jgi:hypothetical protein
MDDIDKCASLIGIPVTSRETLVMSTNERTNEVHEAGEGAAAWKPTKPICD